MGQIPAKDNMITSIILSPKNGENIAAGQDFNITLQVNGLQAGSFTNAVATYYAAPQTLNGKGQVIGHTHVTVQDLGNSLNPQVPPDPTQFAFFKGINDAGNGQGLLSAEVTGGLPAGNFRLCTLTGASNHQPVIMPVAQRGSQDDCTKFTVSDQGGQAQGADKANEAASNGNKGQQAQQLAQQAAQQGQNQQGQNKGQQNQGQQQAQQQGKQQQAQQQGKQQQQGQQQGKQRLARLARRDYVF